MIERERQQQLSRVEEAKRVIREAPINIENEFNRTANSWLACLGSVIFALETYLDSDKVKSEVGEQEYGRIMKNLEGLKEKHYDLKQEYPDKETIPPEEIRQELLDMINVFK